MTPPSPSDADQAPSRGHAGGASDDPVRGDGGSPDDDPALVDDPDLVADEIELTGEILEDGETWQVPLAGGGALVRHDSLSLYLSEINRYQRLSPEEERGLALRWRDERDPTAAGDLVASHLGLVVAIAMGFRRAIANVLDLIQEGNIGLMEAVERFDPDRGARLSTYATWWIRSRIVKYLLDNWRLVRVGTTNARRKLLYNLRREKERLESEGLRPTPKLLAARLGTSTADVIAVDGALGASDVSLDAPLGDEGSATRGDILPAGAGPSPETQATDQDMRERLHAALAEIEPLLSAREHSLLRERLLSDEPVTLQALADREGVTCEAVRQSEKRLIRRLRDHLTERLPEAAGFDFHSEG